eukprot:GHVT01005236.1.p1 GENE.GHVT01005236.1~~GHVT01005236.1.p1  ORF type:complete len:369 (-),score=78.71 GHVT01005236.1:1152-2258(-)
MVVWGQPEPPPRKELECSKLRVGAQLCFELGNCTPWIVGVGCWTNRELHGQARLVASAIAFNGGHVCVHPQLLVTCKQWPQRLEFLSLVREYLGECVHVGAFYPDAEERTKRFNALLAAEVEENERQLGGRTEEGARREKEPDGIKREETEERLTNAGQETTAVQRPNLEIKKTGIFFASDLNPNSTCLAREETFCPVSGEVSLDCDPSTFLTAAVEYVNAKVHGTLGVAISAKANDEDQKQALEVAISSLKYGAVAVNCDPKIPFIFGELPWGGSPGSCDWQGDMQSGSGQLGNCFFYRNVQKGIVRMPFLNSFMVTSVQPSRFLAPRVEKLLRRFAVAAAKPRVAFGGAAVAMDMLKISSGFILNF